MFNRVNRSKAGESLQGWQIIPIVVMAIGAFVKELLTKLLSCLDQNSPLLRPVFDGGATGTQPYAVFAKTIQDTEQDTVVTRHIKSMRNWLYGNSGEPRPFKRRRVKDPKAGGPVRRIKKVEEAISILQHLIEEVPEAPWVVVVDGQGSRFAINLCRKIKKTRETSRFGIVSPPGEESKLTGLKHIRYEASSAHDMHFLKNLLPDLVIVPLEPKDSQEERIQRWIVNRAAYILVESPQGGHRD